jgi:hypothetical protein
LPISILFLQVTDPHKKIGLAAHELHEALHTGRRPSENNADEDINNLITIIPFVEIFDFII